MVEAIGRIIGQLFLQLFWGGGGGIDEIDHNFDDHARSAILMSSVFALFLLQTVWWDVLERLFLDSLRIVDHTMAERITALPSRSFGENLRALVKRYLRYAAYACLYVLARMLLLGSLAPYVANALLLYRWFPKRTVIALVALSFFFPVLLTPMLQYFGLAHSLLRELLEPAFARLKPAFSDYRTMYKKHWMLLCGFTLPLALVIDMPVISFCLYGLMQAAAAHLAVKVIDEELLVKAEKRAKKERIEAEEDANKAE